MCSAWLSASMTGARPEISPISQQPVALCLHGHACSSKLLLALQVPAEDASLAQAQELSSICRWLASGSQDATLALWDLDEMACVWSRQNIEGAVLSVTFRRATHCSSFCLSVVVLMQRLHRLSGLPAQSRPCAARQR